MVLNALTKTGKYLLYLLAGLLILLALLAALVRLAVFYGEDYSAELASLVSRYIGSPVQISKIDLVWNRFDASASLTDVRILSRDNKETLLVLPSIELELNVREMLMRRQLSARSIKLGNISLVGSYEGRGQLKMQGYEISRPAEINSESIAKNGSPKLARTGHSALSWLFNADRIAILNSDITLIDSTRDKEYKLDRVNIRAFNDGDLHQIRVSSALPDSNGQISVASFDFTGQADNINEWTGKFHLDSRNLNLAEISGLWRKQQQNYSGRADVQLWGNWRGTRVNQLRAVVSGKDLQLDIPSATAGEQASLQIKTAEMDLDWSRISGGWEATFNRSEIEFADRVLQLSGLDMYLQRQQGGYRHFRLSGPDLSVEDFQPLYRFADNAGFAIPAELGSIVAGTAKDWLVAGQVVGNVAKLSVVKAFVEKLHVAEYEQVPGIEGLSADVFYSDGVGQITFDKQKVVLTAPELFDSRLPEIDVDGDVRFSVEDEQWIVSAKELRLETADLEISHDFSVRRDAQGKILLNLLASVESADLARVKAYLPGRIMKPQLLDWLQTAIVDGGLRGGKIAASGDLTDFSPADGKGILVGEADIVDGTLKFLPDWPAVIGVDGNLSFDAKSLRGRIYQGSIREANFTDTRVHIPDFRKPVLKIQTSGIGPVEDMLDFAQRGPLASKIGDAFGGSTGIGTARLGLDLEVPLRGDIKDGLVVDGSVALDNASIYAGEFGLDLESVSGEIGFNRAGVAIEDVRASYLGVPVRILATQKSVGEKQINTVSVKGPIAVSSVLHSYGIPLTDSFEGLSEWQVRIDVTHSGPESDTLVELTATSDLSGTAIKFPQPLSKPSDTLLQAQIYKKLSDDSDWWIEIPGLAKTRIRVDEDGELESMAIALGKSDSTVLPWRGVSVHGDVGRADALGWVDFALELEESGDDTSEEAFPLFAKINARELRVGSENMGEAIYIAYRDGTHQVHRLENEFADGELLQRENSDSDEPMVLRLNHLDKILLSAIGTSEPDEAGVTTRPLDPRTLPPLDVTVKKLKWDDWRFSKVSLRTKPEDRGLEISALTARQDSMRVSGNGRWEIYDSSGTIEHATTLDLNASFDDVGTAVRTVLGEETFAEGNGEAALSLGWPSAAYAPDLTEMTGQLFVSLRNGRLLSVEPGAGRILGLFTLQMLPRRLTFDFKDLVRTGFEYTNLSGNFSIANGFASTQNLIVVGPVAEVLVMGDTDFVNYGYNQTIDVLPRVSGAIPIIGALSGGPAGGVTALVADGLLKGIGVNLDEIGRRRYLMGGTWEEPEWHLVEVKPREVTR